MCRLAVTSLPETLIKWILIFLVFCNSLSHSYILCFHLVRSAFHYVLMYSAYLCGLQTSI